MFNITILLGKLISGKRARIPDQFGLSDERKRLHLRRMKQVWAQRKANQQDCFWDAFHVVLKFGFHVNNNIKMFTKTTSGFL